MLQNRRHPRLGIDGIEEAAVRATWRRFIYALWVTLYIALIDLRQREQTISAHSSCSACMPNASEWSSYMLARSSESYAPSPNDLWLHCTMVGWRIEE